jgi:hypothetical protein
MTIDLGDNNIWPEGAKAITKEWKDGLQPGMQIILDHNNIWDDWAKAIAEEWKDRLQPGMTIDLEGNHIWNGWADMIKSLVMKNWVTIDLINNDISEDKKKELKDWEKSYQDQWIMCHVLVNYE